MNNQTGNLILKVVYGELKKDNKDFLKKQDPYCVVTMGDQKFKTKTHHRGGKHPIWNDTFTFKRTNETMLTFIVYDKDLIGRDDFIGEGTMSLTSLLKKYRQTNRVTLSDKGRAAGEVLIETEFRADQTLQNEYPDMQPATSQISSKYPEAQSFNNMPSSRQGLYSNFQPQQQQQQGNIYPSGHQQGEFNDFPLAPQPENYNPYPSAPEQGDLIQQFQGMPQLYHHGLPHTALKQSFEQTERIETTKHQYTASHQTGYMPQQYGVTNNGLGLYPQFQTYYPNTLNNPNAYSFN